MAIIRGNAVVGQSGGPTAAINATLAGVIRGAFEAHCAGVIDKIYGMRNGIEGFLDERMVNLNDVAWLFRALHLLGWMVSRLEQRL